MRPIDIRQYKQELREAIKQERRNMDRQFKQTLDLGVARNVSRLYQYRSCKTVLVYVSTEIEVDTFKIIITKKVFGQIEAVIIRRKIEIFILVIHFFLQLFKLSAVIMSS